MPGEAASQRELPASAAEEAVSGFRAWLEHSPQAAILVGNDGRVIASNEAARTVFGSDEQALPGGSACPAAPFFVDACDPRLQGLLDRLQLTGRACGQLQLRRSAGDLFEGDVTLSAVPTATGAAVTLWRTERLLSATPDSTLKNLANPLLLEQA